MIKKLGRQKKFQYIILLIVFSTVITAGCLELKWKSKQNLGFDGERALLDVQHQVSLGPRIPGTAGHDQILEWMEGILTKNKWEVELQDYEIRGKSITNLVASRGLQDHYILLGAHYDTRIFADYDPNPILKKEPVPGANDGGSGVAVLLELARSLPEQLPVPVQIVFFDAEDNGGIEDWDWILGSRAFVEHLENPPSAVIIVDMVGDVDLKIYKEYNSNQELNDQIWEHARLLGYENVFLPEYKFSILDDHIPFLEAGIPAVDIIDLDYPYWHTTQDTVDKVSAESLQVVGDTLFAWLLSMELSP